MGVEFDLDNGKLMQIECQFLKKVGNVTMYYVHYLVIYLVCLFYITLASCFVFPFFRTSQGAHPAPHCHSFAGQRCRDAIFLMPAMPVEL